MPMSFLVRSRPRNWLKASSRSKVFSKSGSQLMWASKCVQVKEGRIIPENNSSLRTLSRLFSFSSGKETVQLRLRERALATSEGQSTSYDLPVSFVLKKGLACLIMGYWMHSSFHSSCCYSGEHGDDSLNDCYWTDGVTGLLRELLGLQGTKASKALETSRPLDIKVTSYLFQV